jgi:nucleotide-binding universal stress UspA family protein
MTESVGGIFFYLHFPIINVVKFFLLHVSQKPSLLSRPQRELTSLVRFIYSHFDLTACHFLKVKHVFFNPYIFHDAQL